MTHYEKRKQGTIYILVMVLYNIIAGHKQHMQLTHINNIVCLH